MESHTPWIGRLWQGSTRASDGEAYLAYLGRTGFPGYRETPGSRGLLAFRRQGPREARFLLLSLWESEEAIRAFAGPNPSRARFYPEDEQYLVRRGEEVRHFELVHRQGPVWP